MTDSPLDTSPGPAPAQPLAELSAGELLAEAAESEALLRELEVHRLRIAYEWAVSHPALDASETPQGAVLPRVLSEPDTLGGAGTPPVAAFSSEELAIAWACAPTEAASVMADALDLAHRLPLLWTEVTSGMVPVWKARRVARATRHLTEDAAAWVDRQLTGRVSGVGPAMLDRMVAEAASRCEPEALAEREERAKAAWDVTMEHSTTLAGTSQLHAVGDTLDLTRFHDLVCAEAEALAALGDDDPLGVRKARALGAIADHQARLDLTALLGEHSEEQAQAREAAVDRRAATIKLYLHASLTDLIGLADGTVGAGGAVGTVEALGPATLAKIREWLTGSRVTLQPVLHVAGDDRWSVDRHDPPPRMAEQVRLRNETCVFPWCSRPARQCDLDHVEPYQDPDDGGPPGQTAADRLAPLCRRHHRLKTSGRWRYERIGPGEYLWYGPHGVAALVTPFGAIQIPLS